MKEKITPYLRSLLNEPQIANQYVKAIDDDDFNYSDPLMEDEHEVVKGLVHKYDNRALVKVSYQCAAHCRFCTRARQIGDVKGTLTEMDIERIVEYIAAHPEIDDVILSGGDPLYTPQITERLLLKLRNISSVKVLRIGSRLVLQSPKSFQSETVRKVLRLVDEIGRDKPFFLLLHINSPIELTEEVLDVVKYLRTLNVTLLSQTVFLKGVNDNVETLCELFRNLFYIGVIPYYLYHCDEVKGHGHFIVDIDEEVEIVKQVYSKLSGIACPRFVVDVANGYGKIPVPLGFMNEHKEVVADFMGNVIPEYK